MRKVSLLFILFLIVQNLIGQDASMYIAVQLEKFKKNKDALVEVGLSTSEVKSKIGNPKAVEGGFPDTEKVIVSGSPDMAGQMNYSCWFYIYDPVDVLIPESIYFVNGELVSEGTYQSYSGRSEVFYLDGKLIDTHMGDGYKITKNTRLNVKPLKKSETYFENTGNTSIKLIPMYCVVFDKGTQVVAATKAYYVK